MPPLFQRLASRQAPPSSINRLYQVRAFNKVTFPYYLPNSQRRRRAFFHEWRLANQVTRTRKKTQVDSLMERTFMFTQQ
ncbi:hypothetical protein EDD58_102204 [Hazenella coriacea]|uniref:Uncharacterized protein n=1 Tax=Hazenella coriacea TaxID=1179467 RepID=A0A4R3L955_9BACL|nr:hypothetical protein EDD58_102204 [Hazenella coriacea]